jgi:hypothetical protein
MRALFGEGGSLLGEWALWSVPGWQHPSRSMRRGDEGAVRADGGREAGSLLIRESFKMSLDLIHPQNVR